LKPKKYSTLAQSWYANDLFPQSTKAVVRCPRCNHHGHIIAHLNQNIRDQNGGLQVIKYIQHSHFTHDTDKGRHVICEIGRFYVDPKISCDIQYRLKGRKNIPKWLADELYGLNLDAWGDQ